MPENSEARSSTRLMSLQGGYHDVETFCIVMLVAGVRIFFFVTVNALMKSFIVSSLLYRRYTTMKSLPIIAIKA